jgi:hypothetical protein
MPGEIEPGGHQVLSSPVQGLVALALVNQVVLYKSTKLWRWKSQSQEILWINNRWWTQIKRDVAKIKVFLPKMFNLQRLRSTLGCYF